MALVYTVGHSTRTLEELLALLGERGVLTLVDVRRFPGSRRQPHFAGPALAEALRNAGVAYVHERDLGGRRTPRPGSPNTAWRVKGFRGYADHMATAPFRAALDRLIATAERSTSAIMCAEALPWRCHRRLIADALVVRGVRVCHLISAGRMAEHRLDPAARVLEGGQVIYPAPEAGLWA